MGEGGRAFGLEAAKHDAPVLRRRIDGETESKVRHAEDVIDGATRERREPGADSPTLSGRTMAKVPPIEQPLDDQAASDEHREADNDADRDGDPCPRDDQRTEHDSANGSKNDRSEEQYSNPTPGE